MTDLTAKSFSDETNHQLVRQQYATQNLNSKSIQKTIGTYVKLLQHMGPWSGTRLFVQLLFNRINRLEVPSIRYPVSLRKGTSDTLAFHQVFLYREYDIEFGDAPRVVIDGGANIGLFTVLIKNRFPAAKVICIEPDKENFQQLQKNVSNYENVHCENSGLWHREARLKVWDKFDIGKWAMVVEENDYNWNVNAVSIPALMKKHDIEFIDVLKLDIESSEKELFSQNFEPWLSKTKMIIIELHDTMKEGCAKQFFETVNKVLPGYDLSIKGENLVLVNKGLPSTGRQNG
ncbi:MAG TPA: FkbM family methyltransferase [Flavisolibacter sp.]